MFLSVMKMISDIKYWFRSLFKVWVNEYKLVGKGLGRDVVFLCIAIDVSDSLHTHLQSRGG